MNFSKHKNFIDEMMVTFTGNDNSEPVAQEPTTPTAVDSFSSAANDMIQHFISPESDSVFPAQHEVVVSDLSSGDHPTESDPPVEENKIMFEFSDGKLHISLNNTDIYLDQDAIAALKDYLNNVDVTSSSEDQNDDSDDESEDDSNEESDNDSNDESEDLKD